MPHPVCLLTRTALLLLLLLPSACTKEAAPPAPIAVEQAPASLEQAFQPPPKTAAAPKQQDPQVKALVADAINAMRSGDYTGALFALQNLSGRSDLNSDQRELVTRSMMAAHKALEQQAASGNRGAQEALEFRRRNK